MQQLAINDNILVKVRKHRRARNMKISISINGEVKLTLPYYVPYLAGKLYLQDKKNWIIKNVTQLKNKPEQKITANEMKVLRKTAEIKIKQLVEHYTKVYNVGYSRIFIKNHKSRWGSCSAQKNLNFNWRIIMAPEMVIKYVIVHEICHLLEMNHSRKFWQLVALAIPEYREYRKWLTKNGYTLY